MLSGRSASHRSILRWLSTREEEPSAHPENKYATPGHLRIALGDTISWSLGRRRRAGDLVGAYICLRVILTIPLRCGRHGKARAVCEKKSMKARKAGGICLRLG